MRGLRPIMHPRGPLSLVRRDSELRDDDSLAFVLKAAGLVARSEG